MPLLECDLFHGGRVLVKTDPDCAIFEDVLYVPAVGADAFTNRRYGLFGPDGFLLPGAGKPPGLDGAPAGPPHFSPVPRQGLPRADGPFFYMGPFTSHYGHFLIDTLSRFWAWPRYAARRPKILAHGSLPVALFFEPPFARALFTALGLGPDDFVTFNEPMRLGEVILPHPAFAELNYAHSAFARFLNEVGERLCPGPVAAAIDRPVYLTKKEVTAGISHFVNEAAFAERLARAGVEVIAPETLTLAEQVALFRTRRVVSGLIGSAFHTSAFAPPSRLMMLNYHRTLWTNQLLLDQANGNEAVYLYEAAGSRALGGNEHFVNRFQMIDPAGLAEDFLRRLDALTAAPRRAAPVSPAMPSSPAPGTPKHRFAICACARWETRYIVEWLSYYRELGFSHVYLYCNDDDPGPFYERVLPFCQGEAPFVTFRHHPHQGQQYEMYVHFAAHGLHETEWVSFFDIDEFLRLPPGQDIAGFMGRFVPQVECVLFNWVFFGPNGHKTPPDGLVLENFTRREARIHPYTKFVARSRAVAAIDFANRSRAHGFWHEFGTKLDRLVMAANPLGEPVIDYYNSFPDGSELFVNAPARREQLFATSVVHHYAFRSEQAYTERSARGLGGDFHGQAAWKAAAEGPEFAGMLANINAVEDVSLAGFWAAVRARAAGLSTGLPRQAAMPALKPAARPDNISRGKAALQSSYCAHSFAQGAAADAAGGVNGVLDGARQFHTDIEDNPWWQVDLGGIATITEIHVINTTDQTRDRFRDFTLSVSIDGTAWVDLLEKRDGLPVEAPVVWAGPGTAWARFVRVTLLGRNFLHLNQVEVFGHFRSGA